MPTGIILFSVTTAGYFDLRWHRIPNWLVAVTVALSLIWHAAVGGLDGLWGSLAGLLLGTGLLFPIFLLRGMGAGDVKFFGALGAGVTYQHVFPILLTALGVAAATGIYQVLRRGALKQTVVNVVDLSARLLRGRLSPHPAVVIDKKGVLLVHFTGSVAIATWIFVFLLGPA